MIIQGSNNPTTIVFTDNMEEIDELRITLWKNNQQLKVWTKDDVTIEENIVSCPLTQEETKAFPSGVLELEIKWYEDEKTHHAEKKQVTVSERNDLVEMGA